MWDEGIQMARTAYALDAAIEIGDSRKVKEIARILSGQVKAEVSAQAEAGGWYEEYDRLTDRTGYDFSEADVEVQKAAWAMDLGGGRQAVAECHLTEDDDSPWGYGFYFAGFTFDPDEGEWVEQDGGLFWGYRSADDPELTIEVLGSCGMAFDEGDFVRVDTTERKVRKWHASSWTASSGPRRSTCFWR